MALGGGTFIDQNKILPGSYINFVSLAKASAKLGERGVAAIALELDWGIDGEVFEVTQEDFTESSLKVLGRTYDDEKLKGLRDLFKNIRTAYIYNLASGGEKAANDFATARYPGERGNDLSIVIQADIDDPTKLDVYTLLGLRKVDHQTVTRAEELVANDFVEFKEGLTLEETAKTPLTGGTKGVVDGQSHQDFLDKLEPYAINAVGCASEDEVIAGLYAAYTKRMRENVGKKFQCVVFNHKADYEGVVNVTTKAEEGDTDLIYWVTGAIAGCPVNRSNLNKIYDGEFTPIVDSTQGELEESVKKGEFVLHRVNDDMRVLYDLNSLVTLSDEHGEIFQDNQTVRVMDQIANDIATIFNTKYLGTVVNDEAGRISLWSDIVMHHEKLEKIRAIQNFDAKNVKIYEGENKRAVVVHDLVNVTGTMAQLYMTVVME